MGRSLVAFSTLVGGLGLGLAIGYVILVVVSFVPGGERVGEFMVGSEKGAGFGFALIVIPYALLLLHLWLRVNVASLLIRVGDLELAERFASRRLRIGLLRGKREALANRTALMRVAMRGSNYDRVEQLATDAELPRHGLFSPVNIEASFHRWRLEGLLRRENLVACREVVAAAWPISSRGTEVADFCACAAELAVRNGDADEYRLWRERSQFAATDVERMRVVEGFAALRFGSMDPPDLDPHALSWVVEVPGAGLEVAAARAVLTEDDDHLMAAAPWRSSADRRSAHVWDELTSDIGAQGAGSRGFSGRVLYATERL